MYLDVKRFEEIRTEVFAENMTVGYTYNIRWRTVPDFRYSTGPDLEAAN